MGVQVVVAVREVAQTQTVVAVDAVVVGAVVVDVVVAMEGEGADVEVVMEGEMAVEAIVEEELVVVIAEMVEEIVVVVVGVVEVDVVEGGVEEDVVSVLCSYDVSFPELLSTQVVVKLIGRSYTAEHCNILKGPCEPCMHSEFYPIPGPGQRAIRLSGQRLNWEL